MVSYQRSVRAELDGTLRVIGIGLLLLTLTPVSTRFGALEFLPTLAVEVNALQLLGGLAPIGLGCALLAVSFAPGLTRLGSASLALLLLGLTATTIQLTTELFESVLDTLAGGPFPGHAPSLVGAILCAGVAGIVANIDALQRGAIRLATAGSWLFGVAYYALPHRGYPNVVALVGGWGDAVEQGSFAATILPSAVAATPLLLMSCCAALLALSPARRAGWGRATSHLSAFILPALMAMGAYLSVARGFDGGALLFALRAFVVITTLMALPIFCVRALACQLLDDPLPIDEPTSLLRDQVLDRALRELPPSISGADRVEAALLQTPTLRAAHPATRWLVRRRLDELQPVRGDLDGWRAEALAQLNAQETRLGGLLIRLFRRPAIEIAVAVPLLLTGLVLFISPGGPAKGVPEWHLGPEEPEARRFFEETLPAYVVARAERDDAVGRDSGGAVAGYRLRDQRRAAEAQAKAIDPALHEAVESFVSAMDDLEVSGQRWVFGVEAINTNIRALGMPYYVDADGWESLEPDGSVRRFLYLKTFRVERVARFAHGGDTFAAIHVRRLDHLNLRSGLLGLSRDRQPFAMVLLGTIDGYLARLLPSLLLETPTCDPTSAETLPPWRQRLERACGARVAKALEAHQRGLTEHQRRALTEASAHLKRRTDAWMKLETQLRGEDELLLPPRQLVLPPTTLTQLDHLAGPRRVELVKTINDANDALANAGGDPFGPIRAIVIEATERHEVQHQIDGPTLPNPTRLYDLMGGYSDAAVTRASRELSGYLSEFVMDDVHAEFELAHLLNFLREERPGSPEHFAAAVILEVLTGVVVLDANGYTIPERLGEAYDATSRLANDRDARHAHVIAAYAELFGGALPVLTPGGRASTPKTRPATAAP